MKFLQFPELKPAKGIPFSRAHVWRLEKAGQFPKRVNLAERTVAWAEAEIDDWLAARMAERDGIPTAPINIDELGLSVRTRNCLKNLHINSLGDLIQKTEAELFRQPNFGRTSLAEIKQMLAQRGLHLREGFARL